MRWIGVLDKLCSLLLTTPGICSTKVTEYFPISFLSSNMIFVYQPKVTSGYICLKEWDYDHQRSLKENLFSRFVKGYLVSFFCRHGCVSRLFTYLLVSLVFCKKSYVVPYLSCYHFTFFIWKLECAHICLWS